MTRLDRLPNWRIDPATHIWFTYGGRRLQGVAGDTVATALFANGVRIFSRSLKYHRPRGLYGLDGTCSNTHMHIDGIPNVPSEMTLLRQGMAVRPQNVLGSPELDLMGFMDLFDWAMPAGFYYRCMHKPYKLWPFFRKWLRKAAGLGRIDTSFRLKKKYDEVYLNAEVCVIGGGPAGMSAAITAAGRGLRVILLESRPWLGGSFEYRPFEQAPGIPLYTRAGELESEISGKANVRVFLQTRMIGFDKDNLITAVQVGTDKDHYAERYMEIRAGSVVVATGCIERPLIFANNDRPGVMQIGCAHRLARTYGLLPGKKAVFSIGHDLGLEAAVDLFDLGLQILTVADLRRDGHNPSLIYQLEKRGIPFLPGWAASFAHGKKLLTGVTLTAIEGGEDRQIDCDLLVASAGLTPVTGPLCLAGAVLVYDTHTAFFLPKKMPARLHAAGCLLGYHDPLSIEASGRLAGFAAAADCGAAVRRELLEAADFLAELPGPLCGSRLAQAPGRGRKRFICFDEDITVKNIHQACDMGFTAAELVKRFTSAGTGPSQNGIPGHNLPLVISEYQGDATLPCRPTNVRSPLLPTLLATYAGSNIDLFKRTPLHTFQEKHGAVFRRVGSWKRARYFSKDFDCRPEVECVRNRVGLIDVSTLGKFRIFGPDALKALDRVYVSDMSKVREGKVMYSAMCNEDGCLLDDGIATKVGENDYFFTTSTARADSTVEWIRYHTRYDNWDFHVVNLTDVLGAINLAGPQARVVLSKLTNEDISNDSFPFMAYRECTLSGTVKVKVMRLGFVGELSYEIHVPASCTPEVWEMLLEAGREFRIRPIGLEAQNTLRLEKGHVIIGQESEIRTTLHDLGLGFLWSREKSEAKTVGAIALKHTEHQDGRIKLVGFKMENATGPPKDGSIIVDDTIRGYVCTARYSEVLKEPIGLALIEAPLAELGSRLEIFEDGAGERRLHARVVRTPFYDPDGQRLKV